MRAETTRRARGSEYTAPSSRVFVGLTNPLRRYGKDWMKYKQLVQYHIFPYIY